MGPIFTVPVHPNNIDNYQAMQRQRVPLKERINTVFS